MEYLGEIRMFAGNFAPLGYMLCQGQLISIAQNDALFALLGTTYGGDGVNTFALPDLRGRVPIHMGQGPGLTNRTIGQVSGSESVTLMSANFPAHVHPVSGTLSMMTRGDAAGNYSSPTAHSIATAPAKKFFSKTGTGQVMAGLDATATIGTAGASQPHNNMQPYLVINFIIAIVGVFPPQN